MNGQKQLFNVKTMKSQDIKLNDWMRILFGEVPTGFYIEVVIRAAFIFLLLVLSMRIFGRRMAAQINRIEMIALFSLAAAIGVPLQSPDRGLLPGVVIAIVVILIGRVVATLGFKNQRFEAIAEDDFSILVENGVIRIKDMKRTRLTFERLFAQLREQGIKHLGEVKRFYFEANGSFSIVRNDNPCPGLSVIPAYDDDLIREQKMSDQVVCGTCGRKQEDKKEECPNCGDKKWVHALC
jgi:uncharacterized membrane protein YcaP (DUF421 family)